MIKGFLEEFRTEGGKKKKKKKNTGLSTPLRTFTSRWDDVLVTDVLITTAELQTRNPVPRLTKSQVAALCRARPVCTDHT